MEKIDEKTLEEILVTNGYNVTLVTGAGKPLYVDKILSIIVEDEKYDCKCTGYAVTVDSQEHKAESIEELYSLLSKAGADKGEYILDSIDGRFDTVSEMRENVAFDHITMDELLRKYEQADRFSLTTDYGDVRIDNEVADTVLKEIGEAMKNAAKSQYLLLSEEERESLPPFDKLYEEIMQECITYRKKRAKFIEKHDGNVFFCDVFGEGKAKYKAPQELWHLYHAVDFTKTCAYELERLKALKESAPIDRQLESLPSLREALISAKPTFCWHCTISGSLATVFTFKLNERTRAWLKTHKDDYAFNAAFNAEQAGYRLDDLALYCGDRILFSSCTHEEFHNDCLKEQRRN